MTEPSHGEFEAALGSGELVRARVTVDGFHASKHNVFPSSPEIVITNSRFILFSRRGALRKRCEIDVSWPLTDFTQRVNSNKGTALGPFMHS